MITPFTLSVLILGSAQPKLVVSETRGEKSSGASGGKMVKLRPHRNTVRCQDTFPRTVSPSEKSILDWKTASVRTLEFGPTETLSLYF